MLLTAILAWTGHGRTCKLISNNRKRISGCLGPGWKKRWTAKRHKEKFGVGGQGLCINYTSIPWFFFFLEKQTDNKDEKIVQHISTHFTFSLTLFQLVRTFTPLWENRIIIFNFFANLVADRWYCIVFIYFYLITNGVFMFLEHLRVLKLCPGVFISSWCL